MTSRVRAARILCPDTIVATDARGRIHARSSHALGAYPATLTERLDDWARQAPNRTLLAARGESGSWQHLTYGAAFDDVRRIAQSLLDRGLSVERPVVILSGNGLEHALIALAAMYVGIPYAPLAPAYSLLSRDFATLHHVFHVMAPGLVFADDGAKFERALSSLSLDRTEVVVKRPPDSRWTPFDQLVAVTPASDVEAAHARVSRDTVAKILFTSGSTGRPKGVICTQGMLSANQEQLRTVLAFLADEPPVLCDWLPWNHVFGGNHNFGITLYNGGTMYLDAGAPTPATFDVTLRNLREIPTTAYFNVPKGYEMLLPALRADAAFREVFFRRLHMLFYAAAGLRQQVADQMEALAIETCGEPVPWVTGLGSTETAPFAMCTGPMAVPVAGHVGGPVPGLELEAVPVGGVYEMRARGPNVTPGYWRDADLTAAAFDEDGFLRTGDALGLVDPASPAQGFVFLGRLQEDFKLSTGTWVRVGPLRTALLAHFGEIVQDVAIAGHDRDDIRILVFPNLSAFRRLAELPPDAPAGEVLSAPAVVTRMTAALRAFAAAQTGSSTRVEHALLLEDPPSLDAGEATDKGSLNQQAVLRHRAAAVQQLYGDAPAAAIVIDVSRPLEGD